MVISDEKFSTTPVDYPGRRQFSFIFIISNHTIINMIIVETQIESTQITSVLSFTQPAIATVK